jgi:hypothetical protein
LCELAYDTVWRGKQKALDEVYGKWSESFELLFRWKAEVMKRSPRSVVEIDVLQVDGEVYFHRFSVLLNHALRLMFFRLMVSVLTERRFSKTI